MTLSANSAGDMSFDDLFLQHYDRVYGLLYRIVGERGAAEDLAQEVFLKLYRNPPKRHDSNVAAWLYRVATNQGYNYVRSRNRRWRRNVYLLRQPDASADPVQQVEQRHERDQVRRALAKLKPRQAQLLLLRQMGLSYEELARACDVAPASVGKMLSRAAAAFRSAYRKEQKHV